MQPPRVARHATTTAVRCSQHIIVQKRTQRFGWKRRSWISHKTREIPELLDLQNIMNTFILTPFSLYIHNHTNTHIRTLKIYASLPSYFPRIIYIENNVNILRSTCSVRQGLPVPHMHAIHALPFYTGVIYGYTGPTRVATGTPIKYRTRDDIRWRVLFVFRQ